MQTSGNAVTIYPTGASGEVDLRGSGNIYIGNPGYLNIESNTGGWEAILSSDSLSANRNFTFNDWSGNINAATSSFMAGFFVATSTTPSIFTNASTTNFTASAYASTSKFFADGLVTCNT